MYNLTEESLTKCLLDLGETICSRAKKIAGLAISGRTTSVDISISINTHDIPSITISFDQYPDALQIPWERSE